MICTALVYQKLNVKAGSSAADDLSSWPDGVAFVLSAA